MKEDFELEFDQDSSEERAIDFPLSKLSEMINSGGLTKESIALAANKFGDSVRGGGSPLKTLIQSKAVQEYLKNLDSSITEDAIEEADRFDKSERSLFGVSFSVIENAPDYDYSHDDEWVELNREVQVQETKLKVLKDGLKVRTDLLKKYAGVEATLPDGEIVVGAKPVSSAKASKSIRVTIKK